MILSRWTRWTAVAALVVVPSGLATKVLAKTADAVEVRRIRAHFDSVLTELRDRDASGLSAAQRARRSWISSELARYRDRGVFPHNYDFPGQSIPYFVDRKTGTLCAVANVLAASGRRDIVDRVAAANNNVWVDELAGDTAFARWLDDNGLTLHEAARIQVPYVAPSSNGEIARQASFLTIVPLSVLGSTAMTVWNITGNADGHHPAVSWTGMISGGLGVAAGTLLMTKSDDVQMKFGQVGMITMGVGLTSMLASGAVMRRHGVILAAQRDSTRRAIVTDASIAPIVTPKGAAGLGMSLKF